ncbi:hypothetical protein NP493_282g02029 [Ridgeia piscesae]|uniref:CASP C-terminal domain-containing protein n=1 Tax=Ridgeia piscesae TaxID=27915 RepID=A0AAD9NX85_RIDPI|nr:hypothetical protein NP493_282g02029 [Ridgeia piscesae]
MLGESCDVLGESCDVLGESYGHYQVLEGQYKQAFSTMQEQKQLITQLEEDLRSVNAVSSMFRGDAEVSVNAALSKFSCDAEGEAVSSQNAEFVAEALKDVTPETASTQMQGSSKSAADSLLPIVISQRERFRMRAQEMEAHHVAQQQQVQLLTNEMDKLRSDNVKLFEKIKFLQSYPTKGSVASDDTENKYQSQYEEKLDPFSTFSKKERIRKYMNLKPYDKITLSMGRFIMGNKMARTIAFFLHHHPSPPRLPGSLQTCLHQLMQAGSCRTVSSQEWFVISSHDPPPLTCMSLLVTPPGEQRTDNS